MSDSLLQPIDIQEQSISGFNLDLPLSGERIVLRRMKLEDLANFHSYRNDEETAKFQGWSVMSEEAATEFLQNNNIEKIQDGNWFQLAIALKEDDSLVGDLGVCVHIKPGQKRWAELGFTLHPQKRGCGYASEAINVLMDWFCAVAGVTSVSSIVDARNDACIRLLERNDFSRLSSQDTMFKGEMCTEHEYVKLLL